MDANYKLVDGLEGDRMPKSIKAGAARVDITPPVGLIIAGNGKKADGVHDPLYAKALVLRSGRQEVALVVCDLIGLMSHTVEELRALISEKTGIRPGSIFLATPQTHSTPLTISETGHFDPPTRKHRSWFDRLKRAVVRAVSLASERVTEARIGVGTGSAPGIGGNRRPVLRDGTVRTLWYGPREEDIVDWGPEDHEVGVVRLEDCDGRLIAVLFSYRSHPNTSWTTTQYSADYPGRACEVIRQVTDEDVVCLYLNGACGNIDPYKYLRIPQNAFNFPACEEPGAPVMRTFEESRRFGNMLGAEVVRVLEGIDMRAPEPCRLSLASERVALPCHDLSSVDKAESAVRRAQRRVERLRAAKAPADERRRAETALRVANHALGLARGGDLQLDTHAEVQAIALSPDLAIVGVPADYFVEFEIEIKRKSPFRHTLVAAHANGFVGYLPTRIAFAQGSYEPYNSWSTYKPGAGEKVTRAAVALLKRLHRRVG